MIRRLGRLSRGQHWRIVLELTALVIAGAALAHHLHG